MGSRQSIKKGLIIGVVCLGIALVALAGWIAIVAPTRRQAWVALSVPWDEQARMTKVFVLRDWHELFIPPDREIPPPSHLHERPFLVWIVKTIYFSDSFLQVRLQRSTGIEFFPEPRGRLYCVYMPNAQGKPFVRCAKFAAWACRRFVTNEKLSFGTSGFQEIDSVRKVNVMNTSGPDIVVRAICLAAKGDNRVYCLVYVGTKSEFEHDALAVETMLRSFSFAEGAAD